MKNPCGKFRPVEQPYEIWQSHVGDWTWRVLKKYQVNDKGPNARAFCHVTTPFCPHGELGDVYIHEYQSRARRVDVS